MSSNSMALFLKVAILKSRSCTCIEIRLMMTLRPFDAKIRASPLEIPRDFPVITGSDALITAIEDVIQTYVHTWDPKTSSVCPPQTAERPYTLV